MNNVFKEGLWSQEINVADFVQKNITPYEGDASFLVGPSERTLKVWNACLKALEEERANNGVRSLDNVTVSTITSHQAGYIDRENELIVGKNLAEEENYTIGDKVDVYGKEFKITGIYETGSIFYDSAMYTGLSKLQNLTDNEEKISSISIKIKKDAN